VTVALRGGEPTNKTCAAGNAVAVRVTCGAAQHAAVALVEAAGECRYDVEVHDPAGCPVQCARDAAGAVCGGDARGECAAAGDGAECRCRAGFGGPACAAAAATVPPPAREGAAADGGFRAAAWETPALLTALAFAAVLTALRPRAAAPPHRPQKPRGGPPRAGLRAVAAAVVACCFALAAGAALFLIGRGGGGLAAAVPSFAHGDAAAAVVAALVGPPRAADCAHGDALDLDYLEIGTSDFNTHVNIAGDSFASGVRGAAVARGVSVDALQFYLERLPTLPAAMNRKLNFAVTGTVPHASSVPVFFVSPDDITRYDLPDFLRGCNRVGSPHPLAVAYLRDANLTDAARAAAVQSRDVPLVALQELLDAERACRLGQLKIDVEGLDAELLLAYVEWLWLRPACFADSVTFEQKSVNVELTPAENAAFAAAISALGSVGYRLEGARRLQDPLFMYRAADDARGWARRAQLALVADAAGAAGAAGAAAAAAAAAARARADAAVGAPLGDRYLPACLSGALLAADPSVPAPPPAYIQGGDSWNFSGPVEMGVAARRTGLAAVLDCPA